MTQILFFVATLIVTILISWFFARRTPKRARLSIAVDRDELFVPTEQLKSAGLEIVLNGEQIHSVCRSRIAIWNGGGSPIRRSDFVHTDLPRMEIAGSAVLAARVVSASRLQNSFEVSVSERRALLDFEYLDTKEGAIVEVLHQSSQVRVLGSLVGADVEAQRSLNLSDEAMEIIGEPYRERLKSRLRRLADRRFLVLLVPMSVLLVAMLAHEAWTHRNPQLVSLADFDTTTLEGQRELAEEIRSEGSRVMSWWTWLTPFASLILIVLYEMYNSVGLRWVPRSLVAVRQAHSIDAAAFPDPEEPSRS